MPEIAVGHKRRKATELIESSPGQWENMTQSPHPSKTLVRTQEYNQWLLMEKGRLKREVWTMKLNYHLPNSFFSV